MINITFITIGLGTGGAEVMLYNLLANLDRKKFKPCVLSLMSEGAYGDKIRQLDIAVYSAGMPQGKPTIGSVIRASRLLKDTQPDLIQGWMYHGNIAAQFFTKLNRISCPIVWSIHHSLHSIGSENKTTQLLIRLGAYTSKYASSVAFVSDTSRKQHLKLNYSIKNNTVIPNGFDTEAFKPHKNAKEKLCKKLNIPPDAFLIGSIARYHPMKDHVNLLRAGSIFLNKYPNSYLVLTGTNIDNENRDLNDLAARLNISSQLLMLGERDDMPSLIPALDVVTSSSAYGEAFPMIIGEAMSCGVPCVVTDIGDSGRIVDEYGKVVPPKNPQALAEGWDEIYNLGDRERLAMGRAARERIMENFSLRSIVTRYEELYQRCQSQ